jgi:MFS family permease
LPRRGVVVAALVALAAAVFVSGLDQTMVVTILPEIIVDLRVPFTEFDEASWIVTAYLLGYTVAMPLVGRLADLYGYRPLFAACTALFVGGSWWAAESGGLGELVMARGVQAVGGGGMVPIALAATSALASGRARMLALGVIAGAAEAGGVLGPLYGTGMLELAGWRSVFWVNIPLGVVLLALVGACLQARAEGTGRVDYLGGLLAAVALLALALGLSGGGAGLRGWPRGLAFAIAAIAALSFVRYELRSDSPLVPLRLFRAPAFASAGGANLLVGAALIVALVEVPLFATVVLRDDVTGGGLTLLRLTALIPLGALLGGWAAGRLPLSAVSAAGMLISAAGFARLSFWDRGIGEPALTIDLAVTGLGFGVVLAPLAGSALGAAGHGAQAVGASLLTVARMVGMMVALAALSTWGLGEFDRRVGGYELPLQEPGESDAAYDLRLDRYEEKVADAAVFVFDRLFLVAASLCLGAAVLSAWLRAPHERSAGERAGRSA